MAGANRKGRARERRHQLSDYSTSPLSLLAQTGQVDQAIDAYEDVLTANPETPAAANDLAMLLANHRQSDAGSLARTLEIMQPLQETWRRILPGYPRLGLLSQGRIPACGGGVGAGASQRGVHAAATVPPGYDLSQAGPNRGGETTIDRRGKCGATLRRYRSRPEGSWVALTTTIAGNRCLWIRSARATNRFLALDGKLGNRQTGKPVRSQRTQVADTCSCCYASAIGLAVAMQARAGPTG